MFTEVSNLDCGCSIEHKWDFSTQSPLESRSVHLVKCPHCMLTEERKKEKSVRGELERALPWWQFKRLLLDAKNAKSCSYDGFKNSKDESISFASLNEYACHSVDFLATLAPLYERYD